jgi:hypothetical protein
MIPNRSSPLLSLLLALEDLPQYMSGANALVSATTEVRLPSFSPPRLSSPNSHLAKLLAQCSQIESRRSLFLLPGLEDLPRHLSRANASLGDYAIYVIYSCCFLISYFVEHLVSIFDELSKPYKKGRR